MQNYDVIIPELEKKAKQLRKNIYDNCVCTGAGHIASSFSCTEILTVLYYHTIKVDPKNPKWDDRDRFILSKGHSSPIVYNILGDLGFFPIEWLSTCKKKDGKIGEHMQNDVPGVEVSTGSLGHGLGIGCGISLAGKMNLKNYLTFVLLGDGECFEGSVWESIMFAGRSRLNNLVAIVDRNGIGASDFTESGAGLEPFKQKWKSFGWRVKVINGHSVKEILNALNDIRSFKHEKPLVIIANTVKGKGIKCMENDPNWHGKIPDKDKTNVLREELN